MQIHNAVITGSFSYNGADLSNVTSSNAYSASLSTRVSQIEQVYATTGSNSFRADQSVTGSLTVTGQIVAQSLNVQQVTSSIVYSSGSNVFGCDLNSRQTFTGSVYITGSMFVCGNTTADLISLNGALCGTSANFRVNADRNLATKYDTNILLSAQNDSGGPESLRMYADTLRIYTSTTAGGLTERFTIGNTGNAIFSSCVGIGCSTPGFTLDVSGSLNVRTSTGSEIRLISYGGSSAKIRGTRSTLGLEACGALTLETNGANERLRIEVNGQACFACQVCSPRFQADNFGIFRASAFRGGLFTLDGVTGTGTDYSPTIFSEGGAGGGNFYITTGGSATINMAMFCSGITCFRCQVCAPSGVKFGEGSSTLNYYEQGTFTPCYCSAGISSISYGSGKNGYYTRVGRLVAITVNLMTEAATVSGTSPVKVTNLPFVASNSTESSNAVNIADSSRWVSLPPLYGSIAPNTSEILLFYCLGVVGPGTDPLNVPACAFSNGGGNRNILRLSAHYFI